MLRARIVTALILLAGFLVVLFVLPLWGAGVAFAAASGVAGWEWAGMLNMKEMQRRGFAVLIAVACLGCAFVPAIWPILWVLAAGFWMLVVPLWFRQKWMLPRGALGVAVGLLLLLPTWAALMALLQRGPGWLFAAMAVIWVADIAAYFAGRAFGRTKLAPSISPGKTREGAYGAGLGVLAYALGAALLAGIPLPDSGAGWLVAVTGLWLLTGVSILGDLFESMAKRAAGIKDSSHLLPGHGGVLDRIDSLTSALPVVALFLHFRAP